MSEGFIQLSRSEESMYLLLNYPNAFLLLTLIAQRARRYAGGPDGLLPGQCHIGDHECIGLSERQYRTAKDVLRMRRHVLICETCRSRKKSTTGQTTVGTLVKIISTTVYDINFVACDDRIDDRPTTDRRPTDDELIKIKKDNKEKKESPYIPLLTFGSFVKLSQIDLDKLIEDNGKPLVEEIVSRVNDYCAANKKKGYLDYAAAIRNFIRNDKKKPMAKYENPKDDSRKRQLADYTKQNGGFDQNANILRF